MGEVKFITPFLVPYLDPSVLRQSRDLAFVTNDGCRLLANRLFVASLSPLLRSWLEELEDGAAASAFIDCDSLLLRVALEFCETGVVRSVLTAEVADVFHMLGIDLTAMKFLQLEDGAEEVGQYIVDEYKPVTEAEKAAPVAATNNDDGLLGYDLEEDEREAGCELDAFEDEDDEDYSPNKNDQLRRSDRTSRKRRVPVDEHAAKAKKPPAKQRKKGDIPSSGICPHCGEYKSQLISHVQMVHDDTPYTCTICSKVIKGKAKLKIHMTRRHDPVTCETCGKTLSTVKLLKKHQLTFHSENKEDLPFKCRFCPKAYAQKHVLSYHENKHTNTRPYKCRHCNDRFFSHSTRVGHESKVHREGKPPPKRMKIALSEKETCEKCGKLLTRSSLQVHMLKVHGIKSETFPCHECGKMMQDDLSLRKHILHVHPKEEDLRHHCEVCNTRFSIKFKLNNHLETKHPEKFAHHCPTCGRGCATADKLNKHKEKCGKTSACARCGKTFKGPNSLKTHEILVHGNPEDRPYPCSLCKLRLLTPGKLKEHMIHHENKRAHKCSVCGKGFNTQLNKRRHEATMHNVTE